MLEKLLNQLDDMRNLLTLPKRLAALEARVAALEQQPARGAKTKYCEHCGDTDLYIVGTVPGSSPGIRIPKYRCAACQHDSVIE